MPVSMSRRQKRSSGDASTFRVSGTLSTTRIESCCRGDRLAHSGSRRRATQVATQALATWFLCERYQDTEGLDNEVQSYEMSCCFHYRATQEQRDGSSVEKGSAACSSIT